MFIRIVGLVLLLLIAGTAGALHPLEPPDTSSPRATFASFLELTEETARRYFEFRDAPSPTTQDALWQILEKGARLFDLSQVPPATRLKVADETFLLLWDVFARLELPDLEEIPVTSADQEPDVETEELKSWQIPGTEITITRVDEGSHAGEFLFSPDTVAQARRFYELTRGLPSLRSMPIENVYQLNQSFTGWMIPMAWVEALPARANTLVLDQVLWKWFALLLLVGLALGAAVTVFRWARRKPGDGSFRSYLRQLTTPLVILALAQLSRYLAQQQINVTGSAAEAPNYLNEVAYGVAAVWIVWVTARWIAESVITSPRIRPKSLNANIIRLAARFVGLLAVLVFLFRVAHEIGIPVYGLVAGAGVGGLAIALATRSTLENFIGTLNIYADHPVRLGDLCRYGEDPSPDWRRIGYIEEIGLRSTRIRGLDRTITTIPNAEFSNMHIVNLTRRDHILFRNTIGLRYETTTDQLRFVLAELREMLLAHPRIAEDPARVRAIGFGPYSLDVEIYAYVRTSDWNDFLAVQEDLVLRIMKIVENAGTAFAFPARTVYHARDPGLNAEQQQAAEKQVKEWAAGQLLPFPDFHHTYRKQIMDTLDYPPEGSPGADRG